MPRNTRGNPEFPRLTPDQATAAIGLLRAAAEMAVRAYGRLHAIRTPENAATIAGQMQYHKHQESTCLWLIGIIQRQLTRGERRKNAKSTLNSGLDRTGSLGDG